MLTLAMPPQVHLPLKGLVAEAALERLVAGVLTHVRDQVAALGERLAAHHALVRFLACNTRNAGRSVRVDLHYRADLSRRGRREKGRE